MDGVFPAKIDLSCNFPALLLLARSFQIDASPTSPPRSASSSPPPVSPALKPGARVAIGVGSRGIHNIATIVRNVVQYWKEQGMQPFLFPAMGSHGAASAAGQADVLAHYGITESAMGCPIVSQLEVVSLGKTADGIEAFMDRMAYEADGVMLVGRVKWHTDFAGKIESGLFKMMAIGLGKFAGAQRYHAYAYRLGLEHVIRSVGRQVLAIGQDSGRPRHSGRRASQHRQARRRSGGRDGAARGGEPGAGEDPGWRASRWTWTS